MAATVPAIIGGRLRLDFTRTVVIGSSCAGKSTLARQLAATFEAPHVELDALHWLPAWQERPEDEFQSLVRQAVGGDRWVVDGNYLRVRSLVWTRATAIIWLNYSFATVFGRALRRTLRRSLTNEILYSGNRESLRRALFSRDSILWWVLTTHGPRRREFRELFDQEQASAWPLVELRQPHETAALLRTVLA